MLSEDSEQGDMCSSWADELSSCSTLAPVSPYYEGYFYVGTEEVSDNLVVVQLTEEKLFYETKRVRKSLTLALTTMQQSIYLRDQRMVFAIKLTRLDHTVTLSTFQKDNFIQLYLHLAKLCILTAFEKHYRVGKEIGAGTFGTVYDGINIISHENVALKVVEKEKLTHIPHGMHMLHNEIRILQSLRRFHISPLISTYETVDCFILVLEKGCGGHLFDYIQANSQSYGDQMLKSIFRQLLEILKILHSAGFIHRDIKPENIICKDSSRPSIFLCDYSISLRKNETQNPQRNNLRAGTVGYIAPEILNDEDFNEKSDIFSVGCVFFYLFTGKKLFETRDMQEMMWMAENEKYLKKRMEVLRHVKPEVRKLLERLLQFDPKDRPSAGEALEDAYFRDCEPFVPNLGESDDTLTTYLERKISHYLR